MWVISHSNQATTVAKGFAMGQLRTIMGGPRVGVISHHQCSQAHNRQHVPIQHVEPPLLWNILLSRLQVVICSVEWLPNVEKGSLT